jgi:hypothetical protein
MKTGLKTGVKIGLWQRPNAAGPMLKICFNLESFWAKSGKTPLHTYRH